MDYIFVQEILRELNVQLRNSLNPADTLPFMSLHFTPGETQKVKCKLQNDGAGPANDELLNFVRTKPNSFVALLASMEENRNYILLDNVWKYIGSFLAKKGRRQDARVLRGEVEAYKQQLLQSGQIVARHNRGELEDEPKLENLTLRIEGRGGSQTEILTPSGSTPRISSVRSNSSSAISFTASNVEQEENNFEETEINDLDIAVIEVLAKELEKRHEDGKAYWEHVLTDLKLKCTMREKKKISRSPDPGVTFLEWLGDERVVVRQLKEAFDKNTMQQANQILFGNTGDAGDARPFQVIYQRPSEGDNGNQMHSLDIETTDRPRMNIAPFTSLQLNNLNFNNQEQQKPANGIKRVISTQSTDSNTSGQIPVSSEHDESSDVRLSLERNTSVSSASQSPATSTLSPSDTSASSYFPSGPNVSPIMSSMSTGDEHVLSPREIRSSSIATEGSSIDPPIGEENYRQLKESRAITAVDPGKKTTVPNPDVERQHLLEDREHQASVLGHHFDSQRYENLHSHEQPRSNMRASESSDPQSHSFDSVSRLHEPDLGFPTAEDTQSESHIPQNASSTQAGGCDTQVASSQNLIDTGQQIEGNIDDSTSSKNENAREGSTEDVVSEQTLTAAPNPDDIEPLDTASISQEDANT